MVSLLKLAEITEEGVAFQSPHDGSNMLLTPEKSIEIQNSIGKLLHCMLASGAVYCNRSCLCVCGGRAGSVCDGWAVSVTTITRNCMHRSSPNWVCR